MFKDAPEPPIYIETETTRLSIVTGNSPRPSPKRRHPLLSLLIIGITALSLIASIITIANCNI